MIAKKEREQILDTTQSLDNIKETILDTISDLISDLLYYDRKDDDELRVGDIEKAIINNEITIEEMVTHFKNELIKGLGG